MAKKEIAKKEKYDLAVIGGGTAGLRTALAAAHSMKTILISPGKLGGTCLNNGCIPTKAMLHASHMFKQSHEMAKFGISAKPKLNFRKLMSRVLGIINSGQSHIAKSLGKSKLKIIKGTAKFMDKNTITVGGKRISAKNYIIATGAKNFAVPIPGLEDFLTNETVINLSKLPKSIILIGGGYISMEFATFFSQLGCSVTVLERGPRVLHILDEDVTNLLTTIYRDYKVKILTNVHIDEVHGTTVTINDIRNLKSKKRKIKADKILVATGRVPNTIGLGLENAGITLNKRHQIDVNSFLQTSNKKIFAIGDVNGRAMFAHAAKRESHIALHNVENSSKIKMDFEIMPWAVFTYPPVAGVGLNEYQANKRKLKIGILKAPFSRAGRATIIGETQGFVKVIYEKSTKKILGCVIIGPNADDIIHEFVTLMNSKSPDIHTLRKSIHVHPTLSEVMEALKEV